MSYAARADSRPQAPSARPMTLDPHVLLLGLATTFVIAVGKGAFGGGLAMLGIPLLSLGIEPVDAAIIVAPLVAFMDVFALGAFGPATWSKQDLVWLLPGLAAGIGVGAAVFALVDARLVALLIGAITLLFCAEYFLRGRRAEPKNLPVSRPLALLAGAASGFTTFIAHAGGPPTAMYLLRRGVSKTVYAGTTVALFAIANFLKLPPYLALGWSKSGVLLAALCFAPAVPFGVYVGKVLHDRMPARRLFFWCYLLMAAAAGKLFIEAIRSLAA
jgi:uncharacterized protein